MFFCLRHWTTDDSRSPDNVSKLFVRQATKIINNVGNEHLFLAIIQSINIGKVQFDFIEKHLIPPFALLLLLLLLLSLLLLSLLWLFKYYYILLFSCECWRQVLGLEGSLSDNFSVTQQFFFWGGGKTNFPEYLHPSTNIRPLIEKYFGGSKNEKRLYRVCAVHIVQGVNEYRQCDWKILNSPLNFRYV